MTDRTVVRIFEHPCEQCGKTIPPHLAGRSGRTRRYCSNTCQVNGWRASKRGEVRPRIDPEPSPEEWDGRTMYSDTPEPTYLWTRVCVMCSRQQTEKPERMTRSRARLMATAGVPRCSQCSGWCVLEELSMATNSPAKGHSGSYAKLARAWGDL